MKKETSKAVRVQSPHLDTSTFTVSDNSKQDSTNQSINDTSARKGTYPYSMTPEILQKRLDKIETGRISTQVYSCITVCIGCLSFGNALGFSSRYLQADYNTKNETHIAFGNSFSWMTSMVPLGSAFGFGLWTLLATKVGPRKTLLIQTPFVFFTWCLFITTHTLKTISVFRFGLGFFAISYLVCGTYLLNDTIHRSLLKYMRIPFHSTVILGVFMVQILGINLDLIWSIGVCAAIPIIQALMLHFMPESPVYLYHKGEKYAENSLSWYQGKKDIHIGMRNIRKDYEHRSIHFEEIKYMLYSKVVSKGILLVLGLYIFQVGSGYHVFLIYGILIWTRKPLFTQTLDVLLVGGILYLSIVFWMIIHLRWQFRARTALLVSCLVCATSQGLLAVCLYMYDNNLWQGNYLAIMCLICTCLIIFGNDIGLNYYPPILMLDYMPYQVFRFAYAIVMIFFWILVFLTTKLYGLWHSKRPNWLLFGILSILVYFGALYVYFCIVEIKGRSLMQVQLHLGGNPIGNRGARSEQMTTSTAVSKGFQPKVSRSGYVA